MDIHQNQFELSEIQKALYEKKAIFRKQEERLSRAEQKQDLLRAGCYLPGGNTAIVVSMLARVAYVAEVMRNVNLLK